MLTLNPIDPTKSNPNPNHSPNSGHMSIMGTIGTTVDRVAFVWIATAYEYSNTKNSH